MNKHLFIRYIINLLKSAKYVVLNCELDVHVSSYNTHHYGYMAYMLNVFLNFGLVGYSFCILSFFYYLIHEIHTSIIFYKCQYALIYKIYMKCT